MGNPGSVRLLHHSRL